MLTRDRSTGCQRTDDAGVFLQFAFLSGAAARS